MNFINYFIKIKGDIMKKILTVSLAVLAGFALMLGFIMEDPNGSKTPATDQGIYVSGVNTSYGTPVFTDNFDAANDTTALKTRGYKVYYRGTGAQGLTATWFTPTAPPPFNAYNGPAIGYVAANYNVVTGVNNIDSWLVLPRLAGGTLAGDSLYFWSRSPDASTYPDSIRVMYSANDSIPEGTWTELGRFKVSTAGWQKKGFSAPTASANGRFAIRYCVANGGPSGSNSDFIGIDALTIERSAAPPPTLTYPTNVCGYGTLPAYPSGVWAHGSEVLGDTLYVVGGGSAGSASNIMQRYAINSNVFSLGTVLPEAKASAPLVKAGNSLYLIGGGATVSTNGTTCYKYTPGTGWTTIAPLPVALSGHGAVCWGDSVIFVMGGPYSAPATGVYFYRIATNTWGTTTSCLAARRTAAYGIVGNKLIIMAGYNAAFFKNVQIGTIGSNASTITWAAGPDVPGVKTGSSRPGGTGVGTRFYFVPGETTPAPYPVDSIFVFDVPGNAWLPVAYTGRGVAGTGSNYWDAVSSWVSPAGNVKIFITGGALGTSFPGLWTLQVPACSVTNIPGLETPVNFDLSQNYPNPFNPTTKINYSMPKQALVTIKVYDMLGKEVATLVNEVKTAGNYTVEFNGANLSSGVYFYKISAGDFSSVKRMTLIK